MQTNHGIGTHTLELALGKIIVRSLKTMKLTKYNCAHRFTSLRLAFFSLSLSMTSIYGNDLVCLFHSLTPLTIYHLFVNSSKAVRSHFFLGERMNVFNSAVMRANEH